MITSQDKQLISRLIKKYAGNLSTSEMIAFVADTNGMLSICKILVNSNNNDDQATISWLDEQCHQRNVDVRGFLYEVEQILSLFQPGHKVDNHYNTLNLESGASDEEIKHAYRQLSRKYHPDTASSADAASSDMFDKVTKAYHALLNEEQPTSSFSSTPPVNHWRQQKKNHVSRVRKKKSLFWFAVLATILIVTSLIVASNYRKKVMIAGLQSTRAAFIPPDSSIPELDEEKVQLADEVEPSQLIETKSEEMDIPVAPPIQVAINLEKEVEQQILPPEELQLSPDVTEIAVSQIQTPPVEPVKQIEPPATTELIIVVPVKAVKQKEKEPIASKKKEAVPQKPAKEIIKKKPVIVPIAKVAPIMPTTKERQEQTLKKIEGFLHDYTKSYEDKDLLSFTRFFDLDAKENGESLAEILPTYSDLFQKSDTIKLDISILKWENSERILQIDGRFKINIRYKTGDRVQGAGSISFLMREVEGQLSIKETSYQFDN